MKRIIVAALLLALPAAADEPAPTEDPKAAIKDRGIVLKAGKRNLLVVVPSGQPLPESTPADSKFKNATIYFGDAKTLFKLPLSSIGFQSKETISIDDPRVVSSAALHRAGETYELFCGGDGEDELRRFALTAADAKTTAALAKASLRTISIPYQGYLLSRVGGSTSYLYVDRNVTQKDSKEFRLFIGKRGAMKRVPVNEVALDSTALVLVTAKGTLTATLSNERGVFKSVTWGPAKKPAALDAIPVYPNRKLIYRELGVYTRDRTGFPCDEL